MRLIYYSLAIEPGSAHEGQWIHSIRSLRAYNAWLPVWLFVFNDLPEALKREAERQHVYVLPMGNYSEWLQRYHPYGRILAKYPVLHKFLALTEVDTSGLDQALFLDCDTFFFDDPERLFASPGACHWCSREELGSRLSPYGYDPLNVNEEIIGHINAAEGLRWVAPFNTGVCLLNNGIWHTFRQLGGVYFDTVWRLFVGRECWRREAVDSDEIHEAVIRQAGAADVARALPYPSRNFWILEEIATWLTLGHVTNLTQQIFERNQVVQGQECIEAVEQGHRPVLAHYFSYLQDDFLNRVSLP